MRAFTCAMPNGLSTIFLLLTALEDKLDRCESFQALLITRTCYEEKAYFVKLNQNLVSTGKGKTPGKTC